MKTRREFFWMTSLIIAVGVVVYLNSFSGVFVLDDRIQILGNTRIRHLWPPWNFLSGLRPFLHFTFALNYALSGIHVWSYHALNLAIHILAALTLFGIIRRTLLTESLEARYGSSALFLALVISLLWMVHPLQTQSVTYIVQRGESLMGLFYLLTLYCVIRGDESSHSKRWYVGAVLSSLLGMATKEVMATAPFLVLIYDRIFLSHSWTEIFKRRKTLYLGLIASWAMLAPTVPTILRSPSGISTSAGFGFGKISPLEYALTQPGVILHYLRLAFWPHPLVIDYAWPVAKEIKSILHPLVVIGLLLGATWIAFRRKPQVGFLGVWFFLVLAPTSSIMPIADLAFEHRMYLSLAAVIAFVVIVGYEALYSLGVLTKWQKSILATGSVAILVFVLGALTIQRNQVYASEAGIWRDAIMRNPENYRAQNNLGKSLDELGQVEEAIVHLNRALAIQPNFPDAHNNLGNILEKKGELDEAFKHYSAALQANPAHAQAHYNFGNLVAKQGNMDEALLHYSQAVASNPNYAKAHYNLGTALAGKDKVEEAMAHYHEVLRIDPAYVSAHNALGVVLVRQRRFEEALAYYIEALRIKPDYADAHANLGHALVDLSRFKEAQLHYREALRIEPDHAKAHYGLGNILGGEGKLDEAVFHLREAVRLDPSYVEAHNNLGAALFTQGNLEEAQIHFSEALKLRPDDREARRNLEITLEKQGRLGKSNV